MLHSAEVFAAFKVHTAAKSMTSLLLDSNGVLKPFEQWSRDVLPIASHQMGSWLRTEYNTAILRAHQAADWQQFEAQKDVLPNLRWVPSTSATPGKDHLPFWGTVLPVDHPFWSKHRPGDRWNCKCSLEATDDDTTPVPDDEAIRLSPPQKGLESNPGKTAQLFDQSHPFFPDSCASCPFNSGLKNSLATFFGKKQKDCCNCSKINAAIPQQDADGFKLKNHYPNGGEVLIHHLADTKKPDYAPIITIAQHFAKAGEVVKVTPSVHRKSEEYKSIYGQLIGTKYEGKCPDLLIGDRFFEFEGFVKPWNKNKVGRMLSHGIKQSPYIIIDNTKGCSDRFIHNMIKARLNAKAEISEVYVYEGGKLRILFKDGKLL